MTEEEIREITARHLPGYSTLLKNFPKEKLKRGVKLSCVVSLLFTLLTYLSKGDDYKIITVLIADVIAIIPSFAGFILGGFAIIIGFGNKEFLLTTTQPIEGKKLTLYQTYSHVFSFSLLVLCATLFIAFIFKLLSLIEIDIFSIWLTKSANLAGITILVFMLTFSISAIFDMVINVFNLSQEHHFQLYMEEQERLNRENNPGAN